jgi:hypothetical protein
MAVFWLDHISQKYERFGGISGEFGRAMVCILARRSLTQISLDETLDETTS